MASDADYSRKLDAAVRELHASLLPHQPAAWEIARARDAELSQLRQRVVELESMLDDAIDERDAAKRKYLDIAAQFDEYRRVNAAARIAVGRSRSRVSKK